jgi:hypothetical protein
MGLPWTSLKKNSPKTSTFSMAISFRPWDHTKTLTAPYLIIALSVREDGFRPDYPPMRSGTTNSAGSRVTAEKLGK